MVAGRAMTMRTGRSCSALSLMLMAATLPARAADPDVAAYNRCVIEQAVRLSTGTDAADLIAKNAAVICGRRFAKTFEKVDPPLLLAFEEKAVMEATIEVLEVRAKKK
jgi:hypothetical protein